MAPQPSDGIITNYETRISDYDRGITQLKREIELKDQLITQLQNENGWLKSEYSKVNDALNRFLLPPVKTSFWDRFRWKKEVSPVGESRAAA